MRKLLAYALFLVPTTVTVAQTQTVTVLEYCPAPGQFVNTLPAADEESTYEDVLKGAEEQLNGDGSLVHLGTYGGYVTVKFDHAVQNKPGSDLRITGNGFYANADPVYGAATIGGSFEPGIVYVGVGDDVNTAKWYELAGSEYYTTEIHDFSITYYKPTAEEGEHSQFMSVYDNYIRWECSWTDKDGAKRDSTGYHIKNSFHRQTYWPMWTDAETLTFSGGKLPNNAIEQSGKGTYWVQYRYAADSYGYVDASLNSDNYSTFDLDWAVDENGDHVDLDSVNFIRVVCGIFQYCGWLGETSTEVDQFIDLHLTTNDDGTPYDDNPIYITPRENPNAIQRVTYAKASDGKYYNLQGMAVDTPQEGRIYIHNGRKIVYRK